MNKDQMKAIIGGAGDEAELRAADLRIATTQGDARPTAVASGQVVSTEVYDAGRAYAVAEGHVYPGDGAEAYFAGYRAALTSAPAEPADPMDWPLPCDVTVGHGTMRKGVLLRTLVMRMKTLYEMATGNDADMVANRTPEERQALSDKFLAAIHDPRPLHEQIAEVRRQERPSAAVLNMVIGAPAETPPAAGAIDAREQEIIARFLKRTGQYVTNDASREAAIAEAVQKAVDAREQEVPND